MKSWKVLILLSVAIIYSCKEAPSSFGEEFIPPGDRYNFQQAESTSIKDSTYRNEGFPETNAYSQQFVLGKLGDFKSTVLIRFPLTAPDSIKTMLSEGRISIKSTWVEMISSHYYGNKTGNFDFTVHKILNQTDIRKINSTTFPSVVFDAADISSNRIIKDTLTTFNLDKDVVTDWIKVQYDSINTPRNYGVMFIPTPSTNKLVNYFAYENTISKGVRVFFEFVKTGTGAYTDTLNAFATLDTYYAEKPIPVETDKYIYVTGGVTLQNKIKFDIPLLPNNAVMNKATLELYLDSAKSVVANPVDTNYTAMGIIVNVGVVTQSGSIQVDSASVNYITKQSAPNTKKYFGDITSFAQRWINLNANYGLILSISGGEYDATSLSFYGSNYPDPALRPRLKITYTLRNQE